MYAFRQENYEKWLHGFAAKLNLTVKDNLLKTPPELGEGTIQAYNISPHFSYIIMNLELEKDLEFQRETGGLEGFSLSFNQVQTGEDKKILRNDIFLSDTRNSLHTKIPAGSTVKRLIIFYSDELAAKYVPADLLAQLGSFAKDNNISANEYFIGLPHREILKEIFEMEKSDPLGQVKTLSHIIRLTEKFLRSFVTRGRVAAPRHLKKNDLESMQQIEQILSSRLEGFPSLESLAHAVFMSTSKLKNLFKQLYGYTLYDYYNKSRLQRAKEMLITGQCSIKQAGSEIGFSNLSHFAKAFKREFGVLPRDIVKNL